MSILISKIKDQEKDILFSLAEEGACLYGFSSTYLKVMESKNAGWDLIYCDGVLLRRATGELVSIKTERRSETDTIPWRLSCRDWTVSTVARDSVSQDYPASFVNLNLMWIVGSVDIYQKRIEYEGQVISYDQSVVFRSKNQHGRSLMLNNGLFPDYKPTSILTVSNNTDFIEETLSHKYVSLRCSSG